MNRFNTAVLCLLLAAGCGKPTTSSGSADAPEIAKPSEATFISNFKLIPGDGSAPIDDATMILYEGKIHQIGKAKELQPPKGALQREFDGHMVIPMLVNLNGYPGLSMAGDFSAKNYTRDSLVA